MTESILAEIEATTSHFRCLASPGPSVASSRDSWWPASVGIKVDTTFVVAAGTRAVASCTASTVAT